MAEELETHKSIQILSIVDALRYSKSIEKEKQKYFNKELGDLRILEEPYSLIKETKHIYSKVMTGYIHEKVKVVLKEMEANIFKHFVIYGDEGSGKMSFI